MESQRHVTEGYLLLIQCRIWQICILLLPLPGIFIPSRNHLSAMGVKSKKSNFEKGEFRRLSRVAACGTLTGVFPAFEITASAWRWVGPKVGQSEPASTAHDIHASYFLGHSSSLSSVRLRPPSPFFSSDPPVLGLPMHCFNFFGEKEFHT